MRRKKKTYVYRNLHKKCYSVKKDGKVVRHADWVLLTADNVNNVVDMETCGFTVSQKGRERVLREGRKNVHAYAFGINIECLTTEQYAAQQDNAKWLQSITSSMIPVTYNPRLSDSFVRMDDGSRVDKVQQIFLTPQGVWVIL